MGVKERILTYLSIYGKENKYRLARALKIDVWGATKALISLEKEGRIEIEGGRAFLVKGKEPIALKERKQKKKPKIGEEQLPVEEKIEQPKEEIKPEIQPEEPAEEKLKTEEIIEKPEEIPTEEGGEVEEQPEETTVKEEAREEEITKEEVQETEAKPEEGGERIEGTVKFFNPNKGFGFIIGDDEEEYYVHKSALKEGVTIEVNNRVSFKVVQGDRGPKAEEVEWISQV